MFPAPGNEGVLGGPSIGLWAGLLPADGSWEHSWQLSG
jgi:hypothetical protein